MTIATEEQVDARFRAACTWLRIPVPEGDWTLDAACRGMDPDIFFPGRGPHDNDRGCSLARHVCDRCPITLTCLAYAIGTDERFGVWGGQSERQRRQSRRNFHIWQRKRLMVERLFSTVESTPLSAPVDAAGETVAPASPAAPSELT